MEWTNPPAAKRGRTSPKWALVAEKLRANPNVWAKIGTVKFPSQASVIAKTHDIKVVSRKAGENAEGISMYDLYGMFEVEDAS